MLQACSLTALLRSSGWNGDEETTAQVVSWLVEQDLPDTDAMVGLEFRYLADSSRWGAEAGCVRAGAFPNFYAPAPCAQLQVCLKEMITRANEPKRKAPQELHRPVAKAPR